MARPSIAVRRRRVGVVALLAVAVLAACAFVDERANSHARTEQRALVSSRHALARLRFDLGSVRYARGMAGGHLIGVQNSLSQTLQELSAVQQSLSSTDQTSFAQGLSIWTLDTCLAGVKNAYQQIALRDESTATQDISGVSAACRSADGGTNGPAYPFDFPDPFVLPVDGTYFAYATNSAEGNIQIIESTDLSHWNAIGNALPELPAWASPDATWAPAVLPLGGGFVLYYSAVVAGPRGGEQCISAATSPVPQGPFLDHSADPLVCQPDLGGSIDPSPIVVGGVPYLVWKTNGGAAPATIWSEQLDAAGTALAGSAPTRLLQPDERWQGGVVEAPDMVLEGGQYLLFYSGNNWNGSSYGVGVASCRGPLGPCADTSSQPILSSGAGMEGPGGETVFTDASGNWWIAFHAWLPGQVGYPHSRALYVRRLTMAGPGSIVAAAG